MGEVFAFALGIFLTFFPISEFPVEKHTTLFPSSAVERSVIALRDVSDYTSVVLVQWKRFSDDLPREREKDFRPFRPRKDVTLEMWILDDKEEDFSWPLQILEKNMPEVTIDITSFSEEKSYKKVLQEALKKKRPPDIFFVRGQWKDEFLPFMAPAPQELFSQEDCQNFFFPFVCDTFSKGGSMLAMPLFVESLFMIINRDLLRDDRITLLDEPSKTWSGFFENAKNFSRFMDQRFSFVEIDSISLFPFLATLLVQADGAEKDSLILGEHFFVDVDSLDRFLRGNLAIFFATEKEIALLENRIYQKEDVFVRSDAMDILPVPQLIADAPKTYGDTLALTVSQDSLHQDIAWVFLTFLGEEKNIADLSERTKKTPARKALAKGIFRESALMAEPVPSPLRSLDFQEGFRDTLRDLQNREMIPTDFFPQISSLFSL